MRMITRIGVWGLSIFLKDRTVEDSHSRRKLNDSQKCNSMISLGTKLTVQPVLLKKICAGGFVGAFHLKYPFPRSRLIGFCRYYLDPGP